MVGVRVALAFGRPVLRRIGNHEHVVWSRIRLLHGRFRCPTCFPVFLGQHLGAETLADGHYLSELWKIRGGGVRNRMRTSGDCREDGSSTCHGYYDFILFRISGTNIYSQESQERIISLSWIISTFSTPRQNKIIPSVVYHE